MSQHENCYIQNPSIFLHQMLFVCLARNFAQTPIGPVGSPMLWAPHFLPNSFCTIHYHVGKKEFVRSYNLADLHISYATKQNKNHYHHFRVENTAMLTVPNRCRSRYDSAVGFIPIESSFQRITCSQHSHHPSSVTMDWVRTTSRFLVTHLIRPISWSMIGRST